MRSLIKAVKKILPEKWQVGLRVWWLFGFRFYCPVCGGRFRRMLIFGVKPRPDAQCPSCFSLERHRLMWLYLQNRTDFFTRRLRLLHVAPEAVFARIFKTMPNLDYVSADLFSSDAMVKMDIMDIHEPDNSYDVILCSHVLEHVADDRKAMKELFRVLKPGGWAILQVPMSASDKTLEDPSVDTPEARERIFGQYDHVRLYGSDYRQRLEAAGFKVKVDPYVKTLGAENARRLGLLMNEDIYFCSK